MLGIDTDDEDEDTQQERETIVIKEQVTQIQEIKIIVTEQEPDSVHGTSILLVCLVILIIALIILAVWLGVKRMRNQKSRIVVRESVCQLDTSAALQANHTGAKNDKVANADTILEIDDLKNGQQFQPKGGEMQWVESLYGSKLRHKGSNTGIVKAKDPDTAFEGGKASLGHNIFDSRV